MLEFSGSLLSVPKDTPPPPPEGRYIIELGGLGQVFTTRESGLDFSPSSIRWRGGGGGGIVYLGEGLALHSFTNRTLVIGFINLCHVCLLVLLFIGNLYI